MASNFLSFSFSHFYTCPYFFQEISILSMRVFTTPDEYYIGLGPCRLTVINDVGHANGSFHFSKGVFHRLDVGRVHGDGGDIVFGSFLHIRSPTSYRNPVSFRRELLRHVPSNPWTTSEDQRNASSRRGEHFWTHNKTRAV